VNVQLRHLAEMDGDAAAEDAARAAANGDYDDIDDAGGSVCAAAVPVCCLTRDRASVLLWRISVSYDLTMLRGCLYLVWRGVSVCRPYACLFVCLKVYVFLCFHRCLSLFVHLSASRSLSVSISMSMSLCRSL